MNVINVPGSSIHLWTEIQKLKVQYRTVTSSIIQTGPSTRLCRICLIARPDNPVIAEFGYVFFVYPMWLQYLYMIFTPHIL